MEDITILIISSVSLQARKSEATEMRFQMRKQEDQVAVVDILRKVDRR
jgi:hypothetical protein